MTPYLPLIAALVILVIVVTVVIKWFKHSINPGPLVGKGYVKHWRRSK